jgi:hypothetical protein
VLHINGGTARGTSQARLAELLEGQLAGVKSAIV